jgi:ankyrin repeat protein
MFSKAKKEAKRFIRQTLQSGRINERDERGHTPLHHIILSNKPYASSLVKTLLKNGADPDLTSDSGKTPLYTATSLQQKKIVSILLKFGADPNARINNDTTPLHECALNGYDRIAEILCRAGANPNALNAHGKTPKIIAAENQNTRLFATLQLDGLSVFENEELDRKAYSIILRLSKME